MCLEKIINDTRDIFFIRNPRLKNPFMLFCGYFPSAPSVTYFFLKCQPARLRLLVFPGANAPGGQHGTSPQIADQFSGVIPAHPRHSSDVVGVQTFHGVGQAFLRAGANQPPGFITDCTSSPACPCATAASTSRRVRMPASVPPGVGGIGNSGLFPGFVMRNHPSFTMKLRLLLSLLALSCALSVTGFAQSTEAPKPASRGSAGWWKTRNDTFNQRAQQGGFDVMWVGDSITQGWEGAGKKVWAEKIAPLNSANFGISGDKTGNVLWRLQNGNLAGKADPKVAVIMIGTNDTGHSKGKVKAEAIAAGVKAILKEIQDKKPRAKILLLGIFPREASPEGVLRKKNEAANALIARFADDKAVFYKDIGAVFLEKDGTLSKKIMPDLLHLNAEGYQRWADTVVPEIKKLLGK